MLLYSHRIHCLWVKVVPATMGVTDRLTSMKMKLAKEISGIRMLEKK